jgi:hypothetical protein
MTKENIINQLEGILYEGIQDAESHKYIRREGNPGNYKYIYEEPENKKEGKEGKDVYQEMADTLNKYSKTHQEDIQKYIKAEREANLERINDIKAYPEKKEKIKEEIASWEIINKSPYSDSFYNSYDIDWDHKPEGSLRLSNHWNFSQNHGTPEEMREIHCKLNTTKDYVNNTWILAKYNKGIYKVLKVFQSKKETPEYFGDYFVDDKSLHVLDSTNNGYQNE